MRSAFLVLVLAGPAMAMFEQSGSSIRASGMAGSFTAIADDPGAASLNPAGLFQVENRQVASSYRLLYGGVDVGLHAGHVALCLPTKGLGAFALSVQETGFDVHSERVFCLAHGFSLAEGLAFGYGLNGLNLFQKGIPGDSQDFNGFGFGLDLGMFARVYRVWTMGFSARNLNQPRIGVGAESEVASSLGFGLGYSPNPGIRSSLDLVKEPGRSTRVRVGQEFRVIQDYLTLRAGVQTAPVRLAFGLSSGVSNTARSGSPRRAASTGFKGVYLDYALLTHAELPLTHSLGLRVEF